MPYTLTQLASLLKVPPPAGADMSIVGIADLAEAGPHHLAIIGNEQYAKGFAATNAGAVLVKKGLKLPEGPDIPRLEVADVEAATLVLLRAFAPPASHPPPGVDPLARIDPSAKVGEGVRIGPFVTVGPNARIGERCILHSGVAVGESVSMGEDCVLFANVVLRERVSLGCRVVIHAGSVIGTDGFGYRWNGEEHEKIPQIGTVLIEDDVEIGSCVCIDRAKFSATVIGRGTKIDNLVQIAHNVKVGPHCILVGQVGIAGSATLGMGVVLGGQTAVRDHITIGDGAMAAARSAIHEDVPAKSIVSGMPALPHRQSLREQAALRTLPELRVQVRQLVEQIQRLEAGQ